MPRRDHVDERGRETRLGDALARDQLRKAFRVERRDHVPGSHQAHRPDRERIDEVEHRRRVQPHVFALDSEQRDRVVGARDQVARSEAHPLRLAGGAAGEEDLRRFARVRGRRVRDRCRLAQQPLVIVCGAIPCDRDERVRNEDDPAVRLAQYCEYFGRSQPGIERNQDQPEPRAGVIHLEIAKAVAVENGDALARGETHGAQPRGKARDALAELRVAERVFPVCHGDAIGEKARGAVEDSRKVEHARTVRKVSRIGGATLRALHSFSQLCRGKARSPRYLNSRFGR